MENTKGGNAYQLEKGKKKTNSLPETVHWKLLELETSP